MTLEAIGCTNANDYLTVAESAARLNQGVAYVLRQCLQNRLQLSIRFANHTYAKQRRHIPVEIGFVRDFKIAWGLYDRTSTLGTSTDLWDLLMVGSGKICIEREYQKAIHGAEITLTSCIGILVTAPDGDSLRIYELQEYRGDSSKAQRDDEDFCNAVVLPVGGELVIRSSNIEKFILSNAVAPQSTRADRPIERMEVLESNRQEPVQRFVAQENAILAELVCRGYNPKELPKRIPGKKWIKSEIKAALKADTKFRGAKIFDHAWDRLRGRKDIAETV
jgi:hypothetical protein